MLRTLVDLTLHYMHWTNFDTQHLWRLECSPLTLMIHVWSELTIAYTLTDWRTINYIELYHKFYEAYPRADLTTTDNRNKNSKISTCFSKQFINFPIVVRDGGWDGVGPSSAWERKTAEIESLPDLPSHWLLPPTCTSTWVKVASLLLHPVVCFCCPKWICR